MNRYILLFFIAVCTLGQVHAQKQSETQTKKDESPEMSEMEKSLEEALERLKNIDKEWLKNSAKLDSLSLKLDAQQMKELNKYFEDGMKMFQEIDTKEMNELMNKMREGMEKIEWSKLQNFLEDFTKQIQDLNMDPNSKEKKDKTPKTRKI